MASGDNDPVRQQVPRRLAHWRRVRRLTCVLLAVWGAVTLAACWFADALNTVRFAGFPLGFWMASQGAIFIFVGLIALYAWTMDRWETELLRDESAGSGSSTHG